MITAESLRGYPGVRHGFFTREGGVSAGGFASLNCGASTGDDLAKVNENRARVAESLGVQPDRLVTAKQVHGISVAEVTQPFTGALPEYDALVTRVPGLALGVLTADCAPVLFSDFTAGVVGVAHAGWRGAYDGVIEATVAALVRLGAQPDQLVAAVGPTIAQPSYEVSDEFQARFVDGDPASAPFFTAGTRAGHYQFDLPEYVGLRLLRAGLRRIEILERDTAAEAGMFFSYRRSTLVGETAIGRQMSAILLTPR
jgi:YfiH family protein